MEIGTHRPRNVVLRRAAALLYGDWGTSKAYVIGLAFLAAGFSSFSLITGGLPSDRAGRLQLHHRLPAFPGWGRRLFLAREQSRVLAVLGSLLLLADFIVTAAMSSLGSPCSLFWCARIP